MAYICQRVSNLIVFAHRQCGGWSINYLDDFGSAESSEFAQDSYNLMMNIFNAFGVKEATEKAMQPTTRMDFLGNTVDTMKMTIEVSQHRQEELLSLIDKWFKKTSFSLKEPQSLIGKLSFVTNCVRAGRIFINRLLQVLREMPHDKRCSIKQDILDDLAWWKDFLPGFDGVSILWLQDCMIADRWLATDSSTVGSGAVHHNEYIKFKYSQYILETTDHIAQRELYAIMVAIKTWKHELAAKVVRISTDSQISLIAINTEKTRDHFMLHCLREIAWICTKMQILLRAQYIASKENLLPDLLSRWFNPNSRNVRKKFKQKIGINSIHRMVTKDTLSFSYFW